MRGTDRPRSAPLIHAFCRQGARRGSDAGDVSDAQADPTEMTQADA